MVGVVTSGWEQVKNIFSSFPAFVQSALSGLADMILGPFQKACSAISGFIGKIRSGWESAKNVLAGDPEVHAASVKAMDDTNVWNGMPQMATGGIVSAPMAAIIGEAGTEVVTPVDRPSIGIPLWMAAGEMMGVEFGGGSSEGGEVSFSPQVNITVQGNADTGALQQIQDIVHKVLEEERERLSRVAWGV